MCIVCLVYSEGLYCGCECCGDDDDVCVCGDHTLSVCRRDGDVAAAL